MKILTFDVEEWFHILDNDSTKTEKSWRAYEYRIESNMDRIFQLLSDNNQDATFFVLGWIARKFPKIVKKISKLGYEIGSHSDMHELVFSQTKDNFTKDLERSIYNLQDITGKKIVSYRAPGFSVGNSESWVFELLIHLGIENDSSIFPALRAHGGFPQYPYSTPCLLDVGSVGSLREFPINTVRVAGKSFVFSGGGYFRLLPLPVLSYLFERSPYVMTYFHPRDFDNSQPMIEGLSYLRKFKSYYGLKEALGKLESIIQRFELVSLDTASRNTDWSSSPVFKLPACEQSQCSL